MKPAIEIKGIWKEYSKGVDRKYKSLRDTLTGIPAMLRREDTEKFWALQDINFEVMQGESVGIIGRNGAGKSTLLKILSRITPPTKGEIILRGRVASLLEVGTGFHPELTGRENIYFNGSILGMKYAEIRKRFDEIVDFSGVESFLDTPLKHYSSGMQMRLAFSVAAHLDAEILLIDEVLAVGDAEFQKKCLGKMDEVSKAEGKTILFVSHDFNAIQNITNRGILINNSKLQQDNTISIVINTYTSLILRNKTTEFKTIARSGNSIALVDDVKIESLSKKEGIRTFDDVSFTIKISNFDSKNFKILKLDLGINNISGRRVTWMSYTTSDFSSLLKTQEIIFTVFQIPLVPGEYNLNLYLEINHQVSDWVRNCGYFVVSNDYMQGSSLKIPANQGDLLLQYVAKC